MKNIKIKFGVSFFILIIICLLTNQFLLIVNYFVALFLHEMSHYYVARSKGYQVEYIKFDMLGMSLKVNNRINQKDQFLISLAGPLANFLLCILCTSLWWIIPESYFYLDSFFQANLIIALFNLLPIYPLDGGSMLEGLLSKCNRKKATIISRIISVALIISFIALFVYSLKFTVNYFYLLFALFFALNLFTVKKKNEYDLYYDLLFKKGNKNYKVNLIKVDKSQTLYDLFKLIKRSTYTVFYIENTYPTYLSENDLQLYLTKYRFDTKLIDILK